MATERYIFALALVAICSLSVIVHSDDDTLPATSTTPDGVKVIVPDESKRDIPQVQLNFKQKSKSGVVESCRLESIEIVRADDEWGAHFPVGGIALRIAVDDKPNKDNSLSMLLWNREYYVCEGLTETARFRVPRVERGQIAQIDVVVKDLTKPPPTKPPEPKTVEIAVQVGFDVKDFPEIDLKKVPENRHPIVVEYGAPNGLFTPTVADADGKNWTITGAPDGEILLGAYGTFYAAAYVRKASKTSYRLPADADYRIDPAKDPLRDVVVDSAAFPPGPGGVMFYLDKDAKVPVFWVRVDKDAQQPKIRVRPGTYFARFYPESKKDDRGPQKVTEIGPVMIPDGTGSIKLTR